MIDGAGDGNRTHGISLGSLGNAIIRRPLGLDVQSNQTNLFWQRLLTTSDNMIKWLSDFSTILSFTPSQKLYLIADDPRLRFG